MRQHSYLSCMCCDADLTKTGVTRSRCGGCHSVFYDDVTCQKKDWAIHKTECKELQRLFLSTVRPLCPEVDTMAKLLARPDMCKVVASGYLFGGRGFTQNDGLAVFWILKWMKSGDVDAMIALGMYYCLGVVPKKNTEGVKLLRRACEERKYGMDGAQFALGESYLLGRGVEVDKREAAKWFRLAAEEGYAEAQSHLAALLMSGDGGGGGGGGSGDAGVRDEAEAVVWWRKAAEQGHAYSQLEVGESLLRELHRAEAEAEAEEAIGCAHAVQDKSSRALVAKEAMGWFRKSAEQGNAPAQCNVGTCFNNGVGVGKDVTKAVFWFRKAADQGDSTAQVNLGLCHYSGIGGLALNRYEAIRLFRLSADQGNEEAMSLLAGD
eukprot:TRINITY_DN1643_c0_g2_i1.p1 TRINITY_DN1643_c0_g2~~TRINITY_DN1643_c0_g2_i1.p1  ORF type:complete len:379 (+),score=74.23 TRINITY_DN1643_c0_g2_i1:201-1337(+)